MAARRRGRLMGGGGRDDPHAIIITAKRLATSHPKRDMDAFVDEGSVRAQVVMPERRRIAGRARGPAVT